MSIRRTSSLPRSSSKETSASPSCPSSTSNSPVILLRSPEPEVKSSAKSSSAFWAAARASASLSLPPSLEEQPERSKAETAAASRRVRMPRRHREREKNAWVGTHVLCALPARPSHEAHGSTRNRLPNREGRENGAKKGSWTSCDSWFSRRGIDPRLNHEAHETHET